MNRLPLLRRSMIYAAFLLLAGTGVAWEALTPGPAAATLMKIHGGVAMATLVLVGTLLAQHVPAGWLTLKNRLSGSVLVFGLSWLAVSGYLLYYTGDDLLRSIASQTHLWIGVAACLVAVLHTRRSAAIT